MTVKDIIKIHTDKLNDLKGEEHNTPLFYFGIACLGISIYLGVIYNLAYILLGFLIYGISAYKSVKW